MIVRVLNQGQYAVDESHLVALNTFDDAVEAAVEAGDQTGLTQALTGLVRTLDEVGERLADEDLQDSDLVVPDPDATVDEIRAFLADSGADDGLIPG